MLTSLRGEWLRTRRGFAISLPGAILRRVVVPLLLASALSSGVVGTLVRRCAEEWCRKALRGRIGLVSLWSDVLSICGLSLGGVTGACQWNVEKVHEGSRGLLGANEGMMGIDHESA